MSKNTIRHETLGSQAPDGTVLLSYLAMPADASADKPAPAILVAPEWWGVVEHPKEVADKLAALGYVAVVMDIYGEGKITTDAHQANEWMTQMLDDSDELMNRCAIIFNDVADLDFVADGRIGIVGYCFGGKIALDMARLGAPLKAVATFHGNPTAISPATAEKFTAKVLFAHGKADSMVPMAGVDALKDELSAAGVDVTIDVYEGAKHGFTNPYADARAAENGVDLGYHADAAKTSWDKMVAFMQASV